MQVDGHCSYLWQFDGTAHNGIALELREHQGLELTFFLETRESIGTPPKYHAEPENAPCLNGEIVSLLWVGCFADGDRTEMAHRQRNIGLLDTYGRQSSP